MNIVRAEKLAKELMKEHGLDEKGWTFRWDRAKNRFGACHHFNQIISMSIVRVKAHPEEDVVDTILHEIAHALVGRAAGHNRVWQSKAVAIGCSGDRGYKTDIQVESKYTGTCPNGHEISAHKRRKREGSCAKCDPVRFNKEFIITWKQNW